MFMCVRLISDIFIENYNPLFICLICVLNLTEEGTELQQEEIKFANIFFLNSKKSVYVSESDRVKKALHMSKYVLTSVLLNGKGRYPIL